MTAPPKRPNLARRFQGMLRARAPLRQGVLAGRSLAGGGLIVVVAFFLPMVRGCGAEVSAYKATQVNGWFWMYFAAGVALLACGVVLFKITRVLLLYLASAASLPPLLHLVYKSYKELTSGGELEPLVGYWLLLFSLLFGAVYPWVARRSVLREQAGSSTKGGGTISVSYEEAGD